MKGTFRSVARLLGLCTTLVALPLAGCGGPGGACTEIGCESEAVVTFDGSISAIYWLTIDYGSQSATARCNDAGSLESQDNPEWLDCSTTGFEFTGAAADESDIVVTIVLDDPDQTVVFSNELVSMGVTEDGIIEPNGPRLRARLLRAPRVDVVAK